MTELRRPLDLVAEQGGVVDAEQNARLNFADDVIYAHIATLSTAAAIADIEMTIQRKKRQEQLVAMRVRGRKSARAINRKQWNHLDGTVTTDQGGVRLRGRLNFGSTSEHYEAIFPDTVNKSLCSDVGVLRKRLLDSEVALVRPSEVFGVPELKVGIVATHRGLFGTTVDLLSDTPHPEAFDDIFALLRETTFSSRQDTSAHDLLLKTRPQIDAKISTLPTAHFAFHEALGVPGATVDRARQNFSVLTDHLHLPYQLPELGAE